MAVLRIGAGRDRRGILAAEDLQRDVGASAAHRVERFTVSTDSTLTERAHVGIIDRGLGNARQRIRHFRRDKRFARAITQDREGEYNGIAGYARDFREQRVVWKLEKVSRLEFLRATVERFPGDGLPAPVRRPRSRDHEEAARLMLKPLG